MEVGGEGGVEGGIERGNYIKNMLLKSPEKIFASRSNPNQTRPLDE